MLSVSNLYLQYGDRVLMDHLNVVIADRDKVGLVGRNGAGKSTLLKIFAGELTPDEGSVSRPSGSSLGFLHQEIELPKGRSVKEEAMRAFEEMRAMEKRIAELNEIIARRTDYESQEYLDLVEEFSTLNERFHLLGGGSVEAEVEKVLKGLGFQPKDFDQPIETFSGGWKMRIVLAKMLLQRPNYLLLDEPTNHLDIESIIWLESFLANYEGAVVLISHDRQFLDNVTKRTLEIELGNIYDYKAPYTRAMQMRAERIEKQRAAFENQQRVIADKERTINRFMAKATKTRMAQSMQKQLDKMERIEIEEVDAATMNLRFPPAPRSGKVVVEGRNIVKRYGDKLVLDQVNIKLDRGDRVAFVGQNGQGKTTLARLLIGDLALTGGEVELGHNVQIGYYAQEQSETLPSRMTLLEVMEQNSPPERRTQLRSILGAFMFSGEDAEKKVSVLSGGERARLALACLLLRPFNLLLLDEPTNHLDMLSKEVLKNALKAYDGTLIVVSHDRDFLAGLTDRTLEFRDHKLHNHLGDVNFFLEKRKLDNMRDVERSQSAHSDRTASGRELSYEAHKQLQRKVGQAEKRVENLEKKIADMEEQMSDPAFYEKPEAQTITKKYQTLQKDLEKAFSQWESAQLDLDNAVRD